MKIKEILIGLIPAIVTGAWLTLHNPEYLTGILTLGLSLFAGGFIVLAGLTLGGGNEYE